MKQIPRILTVIVLSALSFIQASAQGKASVTIKLKDAATSEAVPYATVSITKKGEEKALKYSLSSSEGKSTISSLPAGTYIVKAELMGYNSWSKEIILKNSPVDLGEIALEESKEMLDAAAVSAVGNAVEFRQDTIIHNASSYLMADNDLLEDLLKKLPGVEVAEDGSVTINGESVKKITIEGKTFFLNDPTMATKNILAKYVKKIKVIEKKSEQAEFSGIDDGERETVIDISVSEGMMKGVFGNANLGIGHDVPAPEKTSVLGNYNDTRYQGSSFMGKFSTKRQLSLILNANNTNNQGSSDRAGGRMRGMMGGGGGGGNGINTSYMGGVNGAWDLFDDAMKVGGNYLFNSSDRNSLSQQYRRTVRAGADDLLYDSESANRNTSYGNRVGARLEHKFSENTEILFEPEIDFGNGNYSNSSTYDTRTDHNGNEIATNEGFTYGSGKNKSLSTSGNFLFKQRLGLPGRTLTFNANYSFNHNETDGLNQSLTRTFREGDIKEYSDSLINQRIDQYSDGRSMTGRLSYTEPLGAGFYFEGNYSLSWNRNTSVKDTYDSGLFDPESFARKTHDFTREGETFNETYSNEIINEHTNQTIGLNFKYQHEQFRVQVGGNANPTLTKNTTVRAGNTIEYKSNIVNWAPLISLAYEPSRQQSLRLRYSGRSNQPSTSQLLAVPDNTNPTHISFGNPLLKPYFNHNGNLEYRKTNRATFASYNIRLGSSLVRNPIVNAKWYNNGGVQYSMPVNGPDRLSANLGGMLNTPIARSNFSITNNFNATYNESGNYEGKDIDMSKYYDEGEFDYAAFTTDYPHIDESKDFVENITRSANVNENFRVNFRADRFEFRVGMNARYNRMWYSAKDEVISRWNNGVNASTTWNWRLTGIGINSQFNYNWYVGYDNMEPEYIWNAEITKQVFKNKVSLSLRASDILAQMKAVSVSEQNGVYRETVSNTLGRYIMFSATYRFGQRQSRGGSRGGGFGGGYGRGGYGGGYGRGGF